MKYYCFGYELPALRFGGFSVMEKDTYIPGNEYGISIETIYRNFGCSLRYASIKCTAGESEDPYYFDLYNRNGELGCMDGESCTLSRINGDGGLEFENKEGESSVSFTLSREEADAGIFIDLSVADDKKICVRRGLDFSDGAGSSFMEVVK
jgi:hypothetical protein